jgi:hypothetical protein
MEEAYNRAFTQLEATLEQASDATQFMLFFWEKVLCPKRMFSPVFCMFFAQRGAIECDKLQHSDLSRAFRW